MSINSKTDQQELIFFDGFVFGNITYSNLSK